MNNSCSQFGEDAWIVANLKLPAKGFYLDIGCNRPDLISNTKFLRDMGWQGIQVDADSSFKPLWDEIGFELTVGIVWIEDKTAFHFDNNKDLSRIVANGQELPAIKLNDLLAKKKCSVIDLLSIDVEGAEYDILNSMDWNKYKPSIIIFEFNTNGHEDHRLCSFLESKGYKPIHKTFANYIYQLTND